MKSYNEERPNILKPFRKVASACLTLTMMATGTSVFAQSAPTILDFTATGTEDNIVLVTAQAPSNVYTDADNDPLFSLRIATVPTNGDLLNDQGVALNAGDVILAADLGGLAFLPDANFNGSDSFTYNCSDGTQFAASDATVTLTVAAVNDEPTSILLTLLDIDENAPISSTVGTLSSVDVDAGDTHTYTLVAGVGDEDNASFSIVTNKLQTNESFNFEVKDSYSIRVRTTDAAGESQEVPFIIAVNNVNDKPEVSIVSETVEAGSTVTFSAGHFILKYSDEDNDALDRIKINSLPILGDLELAGSAVNIGDEIFAADLGNLTYTAPSNFIGRVTFDWNGYDGSEYADTDGKTGIRVFKDRVTTSGGSAATFQPNETYVGSGITRSLTQAGNTATGNNGGVTTGQGGTRPTGGGGSTSTGTLNKMAPGTSASIAGIENPAEFIVHNNYPNPFSSGTTIRYELPAEYMVTVKVFNELGAEVAVLADGIQEPGVKSLTWNPESNLSNGQYFYNINIHDLDGTQLSFKTGVMVKIK